MAEEKRKVRVEERVKIKIGEAKNLPIRSHGSVTERDVFCILSLDQEEIFRTSILEKTLNPFFGEEFSFNVPRRFRYLSVYVYDREKTGKTDRVIGKVAIRREELQSYHNKDHWFQIKPVDQHTEVQGKVHVDLRFDCGIEPGSPERLSVHVLECSDLTLMYGSCDSFATLTLKNTSGRVETRRTRTKKKTNSPVFDETFTFELSGGGTMKGSETRYNVCSQDAGSWTELVVTLFHDSAASPVFIGEVRIPLKRNNPLNAWYLLQPGKRNGKSKVSVCTDIGSLRLKIHYTRDYVFESYMYNDLRKLILDSVSVQPVTSSACYLLGEIIQHKLDAAQPLVRLFLQHGKIVPIVKALATWEISKTSDANTIFRGNTLVSKMMDETMRLAGLHYLHETIKPILETIICERKPCEIDPSRISDMSTLNDNTNNLKEYVESIFQSVTGSALRCPPILCEVFHELRDIATRYFPDNREVRYSVISGFIFLRFFAAAILGPRLFDLTTEHIDSQMNRTLTLISKTIQSLCNLVSSQSTTCKEPYMTYMFETFYTETHLTAVRQFLEIISASSNPTHCSSGDSPVILKEGLLTKRGQGRKRFGRKNFKQRYFRLTTQDLSYAKQKGKEPLCRIPLTDIVAVERLSHESFSKSNMFQIVQPNRVLYVQANNCVEEKEWVDMLFKMCYTNHQRLKTYHPAAYINGQWQCCHGNNEYAKGCSEVCNHLQFSMNVDSDKELARVHSLIIQHMERLKAVINVCDSSRIRGAENAPTCVVEDRVSSLKTLVELRDVACKLQSDVVKYVRHQARETKYGSKQAPIGDDNYLVLAGRLDPGLLGC